MRYLAQPASKTVAAPYVNGFGVDYTDLDAAIAIVDTDKQAITAMAVYNDFSRQSTNIELSIYVRDRWPMTRGVLRAIFWYPFVQLERERVTTRTAASRDNVRRMIRRLGFKPEGRLKRYFGEDDCVIYGMTRAGCPWLQQDRIM